MLIIIFFLLFICSDNDEIFHSLIISAIGENYYRIEQSNNYLIAEKISLHKKEIHSSSTWEFLRKKSNQYFMIGCQGIVSPINNCLGITKNFDRNSEIRIFETKTNFKSSLNISNHVFFIDNFRNLNSQKDNYKIKIGLPDPSTMFSSDFNIIKLNFPKIDSCFINTMIFNFLNDKTKIISLNNPLSLVKLENSRLDIDQDGNMYVLIEVNLNQLIFDENPTLEILSDHSESQKK